jgi:hypothetical protein
MGTTGIVLSYEQCSLVESFVFGSSAMDDEGKRLASWKMSEKCPCVFLGVFEMVRWIF